MTKMTLFIYFSCVFLIMISLYLPEVKGQPDYGPGFGFGNGDGHGHHRVDLVGGFWLYRNVHGSLQYLLLKHAINKDWAPPKGNGEEGESPYDTALRETKEETGLVYGDYVRTTPFKLDFQYWTHDGILKKVTLWPAELKDPWHPIELSEEDEAFLWLDYPAALDYCTKEFKAALRKGHGLVRDIYSSHSRPVGFGPPFSFPYRFLEHGPFRKKSNNTI